uniref:acyl-CoA thioesterase 2-like isoform X4 n=1 Tax=Erigeron canadensis TaxID=72917 RepID=UPI001CB8FDDA|nr:acyl-CoA thioesterase 2-like isoform X4 [Erigeron canadensis]
MYSEAAAMEFLGDVPVLQRLPSSSIRKIAQHVIVKQYNAGEYVFKERKSGDGIYFICEGEVEVSREFHADNQDCQVLQWRKFDHFTQSESVVQEDVIALTKVNTFRGITLKGAPKSGKVYGGQFMGQALAAASKTVHFLKFLHSFHAHFLLAGDVNIPIIYEVDRLNDIPNLATRRVNAVQKERVVFFLIASFHRVEEGLDHQEPSMPSMPDPEMLLTKHGLEEGVKLPRHHPRNEVSTSTSVPWPTEIRPMDTEKYSRHTSRPPSVRYWIRAKGRLPDDQALHRCAGAYFSDMLFIQISLNPHRKEGIFPTSISLDHSMWFHRDIKADDWLLYVIDSPTAFNARGFSRGQMFNRKGELVLTAMQVGVLRALKTPPISVPSKL